MMLFTERESLEDTIIRLLAKGKSTPMDLYEMIMVAGDNPSIQGLYKALRYLVKSGVVVKSGKEIGISQEWIESLSGALVKETLPPQLADGESAAYDFNSLANLDAYWKHLIKPLQDQYADYPIFLYNPYEIWYRIAERKQSEIEYFRGFATRKQYGLYVLGNLTSLDVRFKKDFQNDYMQIDCWQKTPFPLTDFFIIIQDYIITTKLNKNLMHDVASVYRQQVSSEEIGDLLSRLLSKKYRAKIKVEKNVKKAKLLRKKLFKNFYLPVEIREKYELF